LQRRRKWLEYRVLLSILESRCLFRSVGHSAPQLVSMILSWLKYRVSLSHSESNCFFSSAGQSASQLFPKIHSWLKYRVLFSNSAAAACSVRWVSQRRNHDQRYFFWLEYRVFFSESRCLFSSVGQSAPQLSLMITSWIQGCRFSHMTVPLIRHADRATSEVNIGYKCLPHLPFHLFVNSPFPMIPSSQRFCMAYALGRHWQRLG